MIANGITDVKAQEHITLVFEDVMIYILACILERVGLNLGPDVLKEIELFWYESGIKWEGMTSFCEFYLKQSNIKQTEILNKACSISCKQLDHGQLNAFIQLCHDNQISFMFKQLSLCNFDAGPSTGSFGISAGIMHQVGINRYDVCLICNKIVTGGFYWICCVYNNTNSSLTTIKDQAPLAIFFGNNSASIDSLKIALDNGIVPGKYYIFGANRHLRCANANTVTNPFYNGSYSDFLQASSLSTEVELFIHNNVINALTGVVQNLYVRSNAPNYGPCQMFLSTSTVDQQINCVLVIKTAGDCLQECVQKEHYLRTLNDMGTYNIQGNYVEPKNIAADFTVDSFVGNRKFERYSTFSGNVDGTCPGIFQQQSGHGAKYSLPIGGNENPIDKATAFVIKMYGFQSLLKATGQQYISNGKFKQLSSDLFGSENVELGRVFTVVDFIENVNPQWLEAVDETEINNDIFSSFFYRLFQFQQEINLELTKQTINEINTWEGDMITLLSMSPVDHIIRDDVSKDYENNSGNLIAEIFGDWDLEFPKIDLYIWVTDITSTGLECRFLFNINDRADLVDTFKSFRTMLTTDELGETAIELIPGSIEVYFAQKQLQGVITSFNNDKINPDFTIPPDRENPGKTFNWCLTSAYKIPAGLETLISVLKEQATLRMSKNTLDNLKIRIRELATSSVNTLTMRASRSKPEIGEKLDKMLTNFLRKLDISEEGSDIFDEDNVICSFSSSIETDEEADVQEAILNSMSVKRLSDDSKISITNTNKRNKGGSRKTRKRAKKTRRRNTRRPVKRYNKKSLRRYRKKSKTRKR